MGFEFYWKGESNQLREAGALCDANAPRLRLPPKPADTGQRVVDVLASGHPDQSPSE
jgi:hypothetical protein